MDRAMMRRIDKEQARKSAWSLFGVLVVVRVVIQVMPLSWRAAMILSDTLTYFLPMVVSAALAGWMAWSSSKAPSRAERHLWAAVTVAVVAKLVSEFYWTWYVVTIDRSGPPLVSWERSLHALAIAVIFITLVRMTRYGMAPAIQRFELYTDIMAIVVALWPLTYVYWTLPLSGGRGSGDPALAASWALYVLFGVVMIVFTLLVSVAAARRSRPLWERLLALALLFEGVGLALAPLFLSGTVTDNVEGSGWITLLYGCGFVVLIVALVYRLTGDGTPTLEPWPLPRIVSPRSLRYYPMIAAVGVPVLGLLAIQAADQSETSVFLVAMWSLAVVLTARSWLAGYERARMRQRATTDAETGLLTRRMLDRRLMEVIEHSGEAGHESSILVFDAHTLAPPNSTERLDGRDRSTIEFAALIADLTPEGCEAFHVAGERFAVVLEAGGPSEAYELGLKVWLAAERHYGEASGEQPALGVYVGIASFPRHAMAPDMLLAAAEVAVAAAHGAEDEPVVIYDEAITALSPEEHRVRERMRVQRSTVRALAQAVDARDAATKDHSANVADLATALAQVLGLSDRQVQTIGLGALMHDVGKIGIADEILFAERALTEAERREIENHSVLGERILAPARLDEVLPLVRSHHERWDGNGYPDGLQGEDIPIEARVVAVCDAFESITADRPYAKARSIDDALEEIDACAGTQFDPVVCAAFIRMIRGMVSSAGR